jgi:hypothetical protein
MTEHEHSRHKPASDGGGPGFFSTQLGLALTVFLAVGGLLLWFEHRAHLIGALPLLLPLLICVGMHVFMHRGHGGHDGHRGEHDER